MSSKLEGWSPIPSHQMVRILEIWGHYREDVGLEVELIKGTESVDVEPAVKVACRQMLADRVENLQAYHELFRANQ